MADTRILFFAVSLAEEIYQGRFDPTTDSVSVRGTFNGWSGADSTLVDTTGEQTYRIGYLVAGTQGNSIQFKYAITKGGTDTFEFAGASDRNYVLGPEDIPANVSGFPHIFNTLGSIAVPEKSVKTSDVFLFLAESDNASATPYTLFSTENRIGFDGNSPVTDRGIIYSSSPIPITNSRTLQAGLTTTKTSSGIGSGLVQCVAKNIVGQTLYVRAFATNSNATTYGEQKTYTFNKPISPATSLASSVSVSETSTNLSKSLSISWAGALSSGFSWKIYKWDGSHFSEFSTISPMSDPSVLPSKTYTYYIGASNSLGETQFVKSSPRLVTSWAVPSAPTLTAVPSVGAIKLSWTSVANAGWYEVIQDPSGGELILGETQNTEFLVTQLEPQTGYTFSVRAINGGFLSSSSTPITATTPTDSRRINRLISDGDKNTIRMVPRSLTSGNSDSATRRTIPSGVFAKTVVGTSGADASRPYALSLSPQGFLGGMSADDYSDNDWLISGVVLPAGSASAKEKTLLTEVAPISKRRPQTKIFFGSYTGTPIDGRITKTIIHHRISVTDSKAREYFTEGYVKFGKKLELSVLFYSLMSGTIIRIGGPTLFYKDFFKIGGFEETSIRNPSVGTTGREGMTQLVKGDGSQNFVKTLVNCAERPYFIFRVYIPQFLAGIKTTLIVTARDTNQ